MKSSFISNAGEFHTRFKWMIGFRILFATVLMVSTFVFCRGEELPHTGQPYIFLYGISGLLFFASLSYILINKFFDSRGVFAFFQLSLDTLFVTAIIFVTGSFESIFTFLYLVVIIAASMLLYRKGSMFIAAMCSVQYGVLIDLEFYDVITPLVDRGELADLFDWTHILYRITIIMAACFAVAFLSGILAIQAKRARQELKVMEKHLQRAERMATMGELAAGMAHEIKNPLASLSGSIQLLKETAQPGSADHRLMQIVLRETDRLSSIVTDFLLFASPHTGKPVVLRLDQVVEETVELFRQDLLFRDRVDLETHIQGAGWVCLDPGHIRQILWNLLKNGAEAIEGRGRVRVSLFNGRNNRVHLRIEDTGCGIKEEEQKMIFDPFFTTKPTGTGLGLSIIHRMLETCGGMMDYDTRPGQGTVFTLIFTGAAPEQNHHQIL